ncbi:leucine-rich repeat domain-containing protein [Flavobacterium sp. ABG]|uniref:leucine-rich repeat domain-containing protein n=1 Tax=Flavobacterium sp. ABG TaxID=1423322 RepID=UPI00064B3BC1|nr:leucine-rich repeat domain-containing protein [Flavobacterium sp. ABG]KLT67808.1 hypothetical protein AB674_20915 [Flavobacterium sp. ABG]
MGHLLQNTIFGSAKNKANTFIGGVSATLNTPALIASKLKININRIELFSIVGNDIQLLITGGNYEIPASAFVNSTLTYYDDRSGLILSILGNSFQGCTNLTFINLPNLTTISGFFTFQGCTSITTYNFPNLTSLTNSYTFDTNTSLTSFSAPNLILTSSNKCTFLNSNNLSSLTIGKPTSLGDSTFLGTKITSIDLSDCETIEVNVFQNCTLLSNVVNMDKVTSIGAGAFSTCSSLLSFSANSLLTIATGAFQNCKSFTALSFPNLTTISGNYTFQGCTSIVSYHFPSLTTLNNNYTFYNNTSLTSFSAPNLILTSSNKCTFLNSNNLSSLTIGKPTSLGDRTFTGTKIISIDLSDCTTIEADVFQNCTLLSNVVNINKTISIGEGTFSNCISLLNFSANSLLTIASGAFQNCKSLTALNFPNLTTISGNFTFQECSSIVSYHFPNLTNLNNNYTFYNNTSLASFNAPNLILTSSNKCTFLNSNNLSSLTIGKPTSLGDRTFTGTKITSIDLSDCTIIEASAFQNCTLLSNVVNMNQVTSIGANAFSNCSSLLNFSANSLLTIAAETFQNCKSLSTLSFPSLTTIFNNGAFQGCTSLTTCSFPSLTTMTGSSQFYILPSLISFAAPNLVLTSSNLSVFFGCTNLSLILGKPTGLARNVLTGTKITSIDLSNCTTIDTSAFQDCALLSDVTNMDQVTSIGASAFNNCISLLNFSANSLSTIAAGAFINCKSLTALNFPSLTTISNNGLQNCASLTSFNTPNLLTLGLTKTNNSVFAFVKEGITITVPLALRTANDGEPDGDLVYATGTRGAIVNYV